MTYRETQESAAEFLAKLQKLGEDWRYSDEFIGQVVRYRWPCRYPGEVEQREAR